MAIKPKQEAPGYKTLCWEGDSKKMFLSFPQEVIHNAGYQLSKIQRGLDPDHADPMNRVGSGVIELIVNDKSGWFRIFYVTKLGNAVYVLHAFQKKTNKTSQGDIDKGISRYDDLVRRLKADKVIK